MQPSNGPPPGINMAPIMAALQMRQQGNLGGGGTPLQQQMTPGGPTQSAPPAPVSPMGAMPQQVPQGAGDPQATQNGALQAGQKAQGPSFDPETRDLAKSLVQRLLKGL